MSDFIIYKRQVPGRQDKFLANVAKVLQEPDFDDFLGYEQGYAEDEEPGEPLPEEVEPPSQIEHSEDFE